MRIVAHRRAVADRINGGTASVVWEGVSWMENVDLCIQGNKSRQLPWFRRMLGDRNATAVLFWSLPIDRETVEAFPEADIYIPPS